MGSVVIVGAGPAGASLARLLVSRGVDVTLVERQTDFAREFRGELLMPSGLDALHQMGMTTALDSVPQQAARELELYLNARLVFRETVSPEVFPSGLPRAMSQPKLLEALVREAQQSPRLRLYLGASVKDLIFEGGRVVGVRARTAEGEKDLHADLVIGADGRASVARKRGGFACTPLSSPLDVVWFKLPEWPKCQGARAYMGRGHFLIAYRSWDARLQVAWIIVKGSYGNFKTRGRAEWLDEMRAHVSVDLAEHLRNHEADVENPFLLDAALDCVDCWSKPGLLLLGDAAHTMSPVGGQGLNVALRDAIVTANHLVPVLSGSGEPGEIDGALVRIEAERMPEIGMVQSMQARAPQLGFNRSWWAEPLRGVASHLLARRWVRRLAAREVSSFFFGVTEVKLRV